MASTMPVVHGVLIFKDLADFVKWLVENTQASTKITIAGNPGFISVDYEREGYLPARTVNISICT